jgi:carbon storage regulator CsrA
MLVFRCSVQKSFRIGDVTLTILQVRGDRVRFRVDAPGHVPVYRGEVLEYLRDAASKALADVDS